MRALLETGDTHETRHLPRHDVDGRAGHEAAVRGGCQTQINSEAKRKDGRSVPDSRGWDELDDPS